jgi:serine phosphatase RsbU (regulator of sigma subunit)/CRP-like cAMP-binding protein
MLTANAETALGGLGLTGRESRTLLERALTLALPKDATVVEKGHRNDDLHIILEGRVKAFEIDSNGQETVLAYHAAGECFGGAGLCEWPLSASIITLEPCRFLVLTKSDLKTFLPRNPLFAERVFENLLQEVEKNAQELSEAVQQKTAISEILRAISSSPTDIQSLLQAVVENAARLCDTSDAGIMRVEGDEFRLVAKYGPTPIWSLGSKLPVTRGLVTGRSVVDRAPVHVHDLLAAEAEFPEGSAAAKQYGHRTVFAAPLMREGSAIGAIFVRRFEVRPLTEKQIKLLVTFADQAAIAIENVRLINQIQEKSRKVEDQARELSEWNALLKTRVAEQVAQLEQLSNLKHELTLAGEIQKSMLPRSIPRLEGYELGARMIPAKSVGGDFYDIIPLGEDLLGIAVGDVSDKGIPAALFMAMVRSLLRAEAHPGRSLQKVLQSVNRHLMEMNHNEMFVTILFGILNRATHRFHYVRAGHEAPVFFDGQGLIKRMPTANGQALGVFDEITLDEQTLELPKRSMLLVYSDGIPDATDRQNIGFGYDGVVRAVGQLKGASAQGVCDGLIRAVAEHQAGTLQYDDMTAVVVRAV